MSYKALLIGVGFALSASMMAGCMSGLTPSDPTDAGDDATVTATAAKADAVARQIGGSTGFGGTAMDGYRGHFGAMMGFESSADLADPGNHMQIRLHNTTDEACTFHFVYAASHMGLDEVSSEITVPAGETVDFEPPCAEIVGLGSLENVGVPACTVAGGAAYGNDWAVPGFMHADYACGGVFDCYFGPDVDDVDGDGDTTERIATTDAWFGHRGPGGMMGHHHGMGMR